MIHQIQDQLHMELPLRTIFVRPTLEQFAQALRQPDDATAPSCIVPLQPSGSRPPLFLAHLLAGHVTRYQDLARELGENQPVYGIQAHSLSVDGTSRVNVEDMATRYAQEIRGVQPTGPYYLGGYSAGGVFAFEIAQQLMKQGQEIGLLVLFDSGIATPRERETSFLDMVSFITAWEHWPELGLSEEQLRQLDEDSLLDLVLSRGIEANVIPPHTQISNLRWICRSIETHYDAYRRYIPREYSGRITLIRPRETGPRDIAREWERIATKGIEVGVPPKSCTT
jgi:thioesterase domain-containing protein